MKSSHRPAAVAGLFYPAAQAQCRRQVEALLRSCPEATVTTDKGLIVPHAGYVYSGAIAATAYSALGLGSNTQALVAILGPNHRLPLRGMAMDGHSHFMTPLGPVPLRRDIIAELAQLPGLACDNAVHKDEHCIEVQLPFLQVLLGDFSLIPVVVGQTDTASVTALIGTLHGLGALILISSDLSHYLDYEQARELDATTSAAITALDCHLQPQQACGSKAINGMNGFARAQGWRAQLLAQCNSGDSAGDKSRVVGYGAYAYC